MNYSLIANKKNFKKKVYRYKIFDFELLRYHRIEINIQGVFGKIRSWVIYLKSTSARDAVDYNIDNIYRMLMANLK